MDLRDIVIDVINNFQRIYSIKVDERIIEIILSRNEWNLELYGIENEYALLMELLHFVQSEIEELQNVDENKLNNILDVYIGDGLGTHIDELEAYKWVPEVLEKAWKDGQKIFDIAKNVYFGNCDMSSKEVANKLFESIHMVAILLEKEDYKYRDKKDIFEMYEHELSESQLDIDLINEDSMFMSLRLSKYIQSLDGFDDCVPNFSCESPFSMQDNIFVES